MALEIEAGNKKAIVARVTEPENDDEEIQGIPEDTFGKIRLWEEGNPPTPTDLYILLGDYKNSVTNKAKKVKGDDESEVNTKIGKILKTAGVKISDYGKNKRRAFAMDIIVPKSVIDGYSV